MQKKHIIFHVYEHITFQNINDQQLQCTVNNKRIKLDYRCGRNALHLTMGGGIVGGGKGRGWESGAITS